MAKFFVAKKAKLEEKPTQLVVNSINHEGKGIARVDNKVCFVEGALAGETVLAKMTQNKAKLNRYQTIKVLNPSEHRAAPFCQHYSSCGGCNLQHLAENQQVIEKQSAVSQLFKKFAACGQLPWQTPLQASGKAYRRSGRIAAIYSNQDKQLKLGFRRKQSKQIVKIDTCPVIVDTFQNVFTWLNQTLNKLSNPKAISHVQLCSVESGAYIVLRHTQALSQKDRKWLETSVRETTWQLVYEGATGEFSGDFEAPWYRLDNYQLELGFAFNNFIQVNTEINQQMIAQALDWLELVGNESVLDLFCGVGNFSLPLATKVKQVVGIEGEASAIAHAKQNATRNQIDNCEFYCQDLTEQLARQNWFKAHYDILLLDPSRTGAQAILQQLPLTSFAKILYVSCDPVTLARDSAEIIAAGFSIRKVNLMNMFPHTSHIETMVLFTKE